MDRSASMSEPKNLPLNAAKHELQQESATAGSGTSILSSVLQSRATHFSTGGRCRVSCYSEQIKTKKPRIALLTPSRRRGHRTLRGVNTRSENATDVIFFLTDGDAADDLTADQLESLEKQNSGQSQIHVVQFASGQPTGERIKNSPAKSW